MSKNQKGQEAPMNAYYPNSNITFRIYNSQPMGDGENFILANDRTLTEMVRSAEGKILTIIDSAITNERQLEATKSLVRQAIWDQLSNFYCAFLTDDQVKKI